MYRKGMRDEIGMKPDSWDDMRIGGLRQAEGEGASGRHLAWPLQSIRNRHSAASSGAMAPLNAGRSRQEGRARHQGDARGRQFVRALYKRGDGAGRAVLGRCEQQQVHRASAVASLIVNPISGVSDDPEGQSRRWPTRSSSWKPPRPAGSGGWPVVRPILRTSGSSREQQGHTRSSICGYYADHWGEAFKASSGYNHPLLRRHRSEAHADLIGRSDLASARPARGVGGAPNEWPATTGYPGPPGRPPMRSMAISSSRDMMAKVATDEAERRRKRGQVGRRRRARTIFGKWLEVLILSARISDSLRSGQRSVGVQPD